MGTKIGHYVVGSGSDGPNGHNSNLTTYEYVSQSVNKLFSPRRKRPIGVERLFNGTTVQVNVQDVIIGVATTTTYAAFNQTTYWVMESVPATLMPSGSVPGLAVDSDWSSALRAKLIDQSVNLAQALAERKQTAGMFVDFGQRVLRAYKSLRKVDPRGVYRALSGGKDLPKGWKSGFSHAAQQLGDHWLAWQYGIRPLVSDLAGSVEEYYKTRQTSPLIRNFYVPGKGYQDMKTVVATGYNHETLTSLRVRIKCNAEFETGHSDFGQTAQRLGLTNPALLVWEIIPYSFVIDWFVNVGEFLQASQTISGLKRVGISVTSRYIVEGKTSKNGGYSYNRNKTTYREFRTTLPGATLHLNSSPFGKSLDRVYSALALARQPLGTSSLPVRYGR